MAELTPEQIRLEEERLNLINKQNEAAKNLLSTYEKMSKSRGTMKKEDTEILDLSKQLSQITSNLSSSIQKRISGTSSIKDLTKSIKQLEEDRRKNQDLSITLQDKLNKKIESSISNARQANQALITNQQNLTAESEKNLRIQDEIDLIKNAGGQIDRVALALKRQELKDSNSALNNLDASIKKLELKKQINIDLARQAKNAAQAQKDSIKDQEKEIELSKEELNLKKLQETKDKASKALGLDKIKEALSLSAIFKLLVDSVLKADQQTTNLGKSFGISYKAAKGIRDEMVQYSRASKDTFVTTDRLYKAQEGLTEQLGIAVAFSNEERETFARLTEITGLAADEAGKLAMFSSASGKSTKDYVSDLRVAAFSAQQANKIHISDKELLSSVAKLSAGILVKFQGNPKALAAAVIQAKALGLSLEQVDKIGESMLDFQSSIENELEAELITGKKLNFERARAAALTGDQATLMQEVAAQAGSLEEFSNMNVIAQESLAKAFGMQRGEMAEMLMKQEMINSYGDEANKLNKEQMEDFRQQNKEKGVSLEQYLKEQDNQRSIQESFNDSMEKLKDIFGNLVAGPLGQFISFLAQGLDYITAIGAGMATIYAITKAVQIVNGVTVGLKAAQLASEQGLNAATAARRALLGSELAQTVAIATAWAIANPFKAILGLGIAAGVGVMAYNAAKSAPKFAEGGIVTSEINNATVGEAGPEAIIPLGSSKANKMLGGGNVDLSPMIAAINEVRNAVNALANKSTNVIMDSQKVGALVGKRAETGTEQSKNSYKVA